MTGEHNTQEAAEEIWRRYLMGGDIAVFPLISSFTLKDLKRVFRAIPLDPRCRLCYLPFSGPGGWVARHVLGRAPSRLNPNLCNTCEDFIRQHQGGAEVELTMLFADVRGSTTLAEGMSAAEFRALINRFYQTTTHVLIQADAMIEKLIGDGVAAFFVPGFAGPQHARRGVEAGRRLLEATGHLQAGGPWLPIGVGPHTGLAYVGAVGSEQGIADIAVLGDTVNVAARLASEAGPGEVLVSAAAAQAAGLAPGGSELRRLQLKGRNEPVDAWVLGASRL